MQPILILTKNLLLEQPLQEQLQLLNYEVLCSVHLLQQVKEEPQAIAKFQVVIFSETVTNREVTTIVSHLTPNSFIFFRKFGKAPTSEEQEQLRALGITEWLTEGTSVDLLREHLSEKIEQLQQTGEKEGRSLQLNTELTNQIFENFLKTLTKKENQAFLYLRAAEGGIISREELCDYLWSEPLSHSRMSQLSVLVKNIKQKLQDFGFSEDLLRTIWGKGYCLTPDFFTSNMK